MHHLNPGTVVLTLDGQAFRLMHATQVEHHQTYANELTVARKHIRHMARACAESGGTVRACPWPQGTEAHAHFVNDFHAAKRELVEADLVE